jgi:hypothetical protein
MATTKDVKRKPLLDDHAYSTTRPTPQVPDALRGVIANVRNRISALESRPLEVTIKNQLPYEGIGFEAVLFFASGFLFGLACAHWVMRVL